MGGQQRQFFQSLLVGQLSKCRRIRFSEMIYATKIRRIDFGKREQQRGLSANQFLSGNIGALARKET
jgi:hypothetical protein